MVLVRKKGESFFIGNNIEITVLGVEGDRVKVGIDAPDDIPILRKELYQYIAEENKRALLSLENILIDKVAQKLKEKDDTK